MPNNQTKRLAQGAMMIALFTVLIAIAYYIPVISLIATFLAPLPIAWYSATYDRNSSIFVAIIGCIITFFFGGLLIVPFALIFASIGLVMGIGIGLKKSKISIFMSTGITVLITFAIEYLISLKVFEVDFIRDSLQLMRESYEKSIEFSKNLTGQSPMTEEALDYLFTTMELSIPASITIAIFFYTFIIIAINLPILKRLGIDTPKFNAFKDLRMPRAILWYYLIVLSISLFVQPEVGTALHVICLNLSLILWILLTIQGISFVHYCLDLMGVPRFVKSLVTVISIPLYSFFVLIGVLDLGFNIRSFAKGKIQK